MKWTRRKTIIAGVLGAGFAGVGWWFSYERDRLGGRGLFNVKSGEAGLNGWMKIAGPASAYQFKSAIDNLILLYAI